jgi:hypothetical protein
MAVRWRQIQIYPGFCLSVNKQKQQVIARDRGVMEWILEFYRVTVHLLEFYPTIAPLVS